MSELEMREEVAGYKPWYNRIDAEVAAECGCESCGSKNVYFAGFQRDGSRRAFIVCRDCGDALEF